MSNVSKGQTPVRIGLWQNNRTNRIFIATCQTMDGYIIAIKFSGIITYEFARSDWIEGFTFLRE